MGLTFENAGTNVKALVERTMEKNFPKLHEAGGTINVLFAYKTNRHDAPIQALKHDGRAVQAQISITSKQDRARGCEDAKLVIDNFGWDTMRDTHRAALIDHELRHLALVHHRPSKRNNYVDGVKLDDRGRPMLRTVPHDWELTGFAATAELYGDHSPEAKQFLHFRAEYGHQFELFGDIIASVVRASAPQIESKGESIGYPGKPSPPKRSRRKAK